MNNDTWLMTSSLYEAYIIILQPLAYLVDIMIRVYYRTYKENTKIEQNIYLKSRSQRWISMYVYLNCLIEEATKFTAEVLASTRPRERKKMIWKDKKLFLSLWCVYCCSFEVMYNNLIYYYGPFQEDICSVVCWQARYIFLFFTKKNESSLKWNSREKKTK